MLYCQTFRPERRHTHGHTSHDYTNICAYRPNIIQIHTPSHNTKGTLKIHTPITLHAKVKYI